MGSMSWRWSACAEENGGAACKAIVFASSLNPVSAEGYRFSSKAGAPFVAGFEESYRKMDAMPCDILISAHPDNAGPGRYSDMRSEERRVGKEWVSTCRCRGSPSH